MARGNGSSPGYVRNCPSNMKSPPIHRIVSSWWCGILLQVIFSFNESVTAFCLLPAALRLLTYTLSAMDMSSFYPADGAGALTSQVTPHVSFRAGMLNRDANTNRVTADPRKGTFQITTSPEDGLMHLQWRPRNSPTVEQDLILFQGETEMKQVTSCPASARVYVLRWKEQADPRMFFWLQGTDLTQDAVNVTAANNVLDNGPDHQQSTPTLTPSADPIPTPPHNQVVHDTDVDMHTPQESLHNPPPAVNPPPAHQITLDQLMAAMPRRGETAEQRLAAQRQLMLSTPSLVQVLSTERLQPVLENPAVQALLPRLFEHLPEQDRSVEGLNEVLRSPPFRAQVASLSYALQTSGASDILRSFGLPMDDTFSPYGLKAFLEALIKYQKDSKPGQ